MSSGRSSSSLAAIQRDVFRALQRGTPADPRASRHVRGQGRLGPAARLRIYSEQYPLRLHDALYEDHPNLVKLLGDRKFFALARAYGKAAGSRHYSLGAFGGGLARFLSHRPRGFARPDLADLARFEWALVRSFLAPDAGAKVTMADLAGLGPERFPAASVRLAPSVLLVPLEHDVAAVVEALEAGKPAPRAKAERSARPAVRIVWRQGFEVFHRPVEAPEARALRRARAGRPLAEVCAAFRSEQAAFSALSSWAQEQMLCGLQAP